MPLFGLDCQDYIKDHQQKKINIDLGYTDIFLPLIPNLNWHSFLPLIIFLRSGSKDLVV